MPSFFEEERDRLSREISAGFEGLLSETNVMNRKLEEVLGMTREYDTIAALWESFYDLMKSQSGGTGSDAPIVPGTGGHTVSTSGDPNP